MGEFSNENLKKYSSEELIRLLQYEAGRAQRLEREVADLEGTLDAVIEERDKFFDRLKFLRDEIKKTRQWRETREAGRMNTATDVSLFASAPPSVLIGLDRELRDLRVDAAAALRGEEESDG